MTTRRLKRIETSHAAGCMLTLTLLVGCVSTDKILGEAMAGSGGRAAGGETNEGGDSANGGGSVGSTPLSGSAGDAGAPLSGSGGQPSAAGAAGQPGSAGGDSSAASCVVDGRVYPSGSGGIQDPFSCNQCSCDNGRLDCTEINCATPCPRGTAPASQCLQCGPVDQCLSIEYKCLSSCTDQGDCATEDYCLNGTCHSALGVCG